MNAQELLQEISDYCRRTGLAESTFGRRAVNDGKLVNPAGDNAAEPKPDTPGRLVEQVAAHFGGLELLVNSAGVMNRLPLETVTETEWDETFAVNARAPFFLSLAAARVIALSPARTADRAPRFIARLAYPTYYADLIVPEAEAYDLDPLLMFALVRQESLFEGIATSSATDDASRAPARKSAAWRIAKRSLAQPTRPACPPEPTSTMRMRTRE